MRNLLKVALAILPAALFISSTANAAQESWRQTCSGPEVVCGPAAASPVKTKSHAAAKSGKATASAGHAKTTKVAKSASEPKSAKVASTHKAKKATVASDDEPKAKPAKKTAKASGGGGSAFQSGMASWYGGNFHGRKTANGETYNMWSLTAAHKTLAFGTRVRVTNTRNGDYVDVRINDRGPFVGGRIIDLSRAAAGEIGLTSSGVAPVKVAILGKG